MTRQMPLENSMRSTGVQLYGWPLFLEFVYVVLFTAVQVYGSLVFPWTAEAPYVTYAVDGGF